MTSSTLIDTDILIDAGRGVPDAIRHLSQTRVSSSLAISVVTQMELIVGCQNKTELRKLERFLKQFQIIPLDTVMSDKAVELLRRYRLSHGLMIADSLIASTAIIQGWPFVSKNQKDYRSIRELELLPYP